MVSGAIFDKKILNERNLDSVRIFVTCKKLK